MSLGDGAYEYGGSDLNGFFGQRRNLLRPDHWCLLRDIRRFFASASERLETLGDEVTLGEFLQKEGYSTPFVENHILPMGAAIWSTHAERMLAFPARSFLRFYDNHGLLRLSGRPLWRSIAGGSRAYVRRLAEDAGFEAQLNARICRVMRHDRFVHLVDSRGVARPFDHVVLATHADQALALLDEPSPQEAEWLGRFSYQDNLAVLHRDRRWMPKRRRLWSSWNYLAPQGETNSSLCVTYWMNRLQMLDGDTDFFVTLNPPGPIHPKAVDRTMSYRHPVFTAGAIAAQRHLWSLQGRRRTWFCGSYFGYGFHEDGAQAGLAVAEQLGGVRRPWRVENESGRIVLGPPPMPVAAE